jgi:hypothetical protein
MVQFDDVSQCALHGCGDFGHGLGGSGGSSTRSGAAPRLPLMQDKVPFPNEVEVEHMPVLIPAWVVVLIVRRDAKRKQKLRGGRSCTEGTAE